MKHPILTLINPTLECEVLAALGTGTAANPPGLLFSPALNGPRRF